MPSLAELVDVVIRLQAHDVRRGYAAVLRPEAILVALEAGRGLPELRQEAHRLLRVAQVLALGAAPADAPTISRPLPASTSTPAPFAPAGFSISQQRRAPQP